MFVAVKMDIVNEEDADNTVSYLLRPYFALSKQYNQIMSNSACRVRFPNDSITDTVHAGSGSQFT